MSRPAWVAILAAIAFPSIAVLVVVLARPPMYPPPPGAPPGLGAWPPGPHKGPPPPIPDEALIRLRLQLGLSDDQVEQIRKIGDPARRRMAELGARLDEEERALGRALEAGEGAEVDEKAVRTRLEELSAIRLELDTVTVLTPLRLRAVLTPEQRSKLVDLWRGRGPGPGKSPPFDGPPPHGPPPGPPLDGLIAPPPPPPP
jgi:Spy/CpxP family protein refolding chaperone